ncbi:hypothetical protein QZH41_007635 [Actinostola sp. cb2023]|nr:hypothetical protein QZH41_007635 [Actinostola sp. cb2023]
MFRDDYINFINDIISKGYARPKSENNLKRDDDLDWDSENSVDDCTRWQAWLSDLPKLGQFPFKRCIKPQGFDKIVSTHARGSSGFCPRSEVTGRNNPLDKLPAITMHGL